MDICGKNIASAKGKNDFGSDFFSPKSDIFFKLKGSEKNGGGEVWMKMKSEARTFHAVVSFSTSLSE